MLVWLLACADPPDAGGQATPSAAEWDTPQDPLVETCANLHDDDLDGLADCADPDCAGPACAEVCDNGRDDDDDGLEDCEDDSCWCGEACDCDVDDDGYVAVSMGGADCDDGAAHVHPQAVERCNGQDDDCDGLVDQEDNDLDDSVATLVYRDADLDGFGDPEATDLLCAEAAGWVRLKSDCDDADPQVHPAAVEVCNGWDDDCDGEVDEDDDDFDASTLLEWFDDVDYDGVGAPSVPTLACERPDEDEALGTGDCAPNDPAIRAGLWVADGDLDGFGAGAPWPVEQCNAPAAGFVPRGVRDDCDDTDPSIGPGPGELCGNGVDDDCNGVVDDCHCTTVTVARIQGYSTLSASPWDDVVSGQPPDGCQVTVLDYDLGFNLDDLVADGVEAIVSDLLPFDPLSSYQLDAIAAFCEQGYGGIVLDAPLHYLSNDYSNRSALVGADPTQDYASFYSLGMPMHHRAYGHPLLVGLADPFTFGLGAQATIAPAAWGTLLLPGATLVASDDDDEHAVIAYEGPRHRGVWVTHGLYLASDLTALVVLHNAAVWAAGYEP